MMRVCTFLMCWTHFVRHPLIPNWIKLRRGAVYHRPRVRLMHKRGLYSLVSNCFIVEKYEMYPRVFGFSADIEQHNHIISADGRLLGCRCQTIFTRVRPWLSASCFLSRHWSARRQTCNVSSGWKGRCFPLLLLQRTFLKGNGRWK